MSVSFKQGAELNGRYILHEEVGSGGYATVWRAFDKNLNRDVALKRLFKRNALASSNVELEEVLDEARKQAKLIHHNIVQVHDAISVEDEALIVMEFVDGKSLYDSLRIAIAENKLYPMERTVAILRDVLEGVDHAHRSQICHRDLTPMNILLTTTGVPKIADFGIARVLKPQERQVEAITQSTQGGTGNRNYMSPEQLRNEPADFLSDLFTVGICGYLLLTGRHPFSHPSGLFSVEELILNPDYAPETPRPAAILSEVQQRQFREYADIVMRLLNREAARRFASAREVIDQIDAVTPSVECPNPECGERIPDHFKYCGFCAADLYAPLTRQTTTTPPPNATLDIAEGFCNEGYRLARLGDWKSAISFYEHALEVEPTHRKTIWNLGHALNRIGDHNEAAKVLTDGINLPIGGNDFRFGMYYERSVARTRLKDYDGALSDINAALANPKYKDSIKAIYHRACIHRFRGDLRLADEDLRKVLSQQADHVGAIRLLEQIKNPSASLIPDEKKNLSQQPRESASDFITSWQYLESLTKVFGDAQGKQRDLFRWGKTAVSITPTEVVVRRKLDRLREIRNSLLHGRNTEVSEKVLQEALKEAGSLANLLQAGTFVEAMNFLSPAERSDVLGAMIHQNMKRMEIKPELRDYMTAHGYSNVAFPGISMEMWQNDGVKLWTRALFTTLFFEASGKPIDREERIIRGTITVSTDGEVDFSEIELKGKP